MNWYCLYIYGNLIRVSQYFRNRIITYKMIMILNESEWHYLGSFPGYKIGNFVLKARFVFFHGEILLVCFDSVKKKSNMSVLKLTFQGHGNVQS